MAGTGKDVDKAAEGLLAGYSLVKYYGFNPVIKRTVAETGPTPPGESLLGVDEEVVVPVPRPPVAVQQQHESNRGGVVTFAEVADEHEVAGRL